MYLVMNSPGRNTEVQILELIRRRKHYGKFRSILKDTFFGDSSTREVFVEIDSHFKRNPTSVRLALADLASLLRVRIEQEETLRDCIGVLKTMRKWSKKIDPATVKTIATQWAKKQLVKVALYEGLESLTSNDGINLPGIRNQLALAENLDLDDGEDEYDYFNAFSERLVENLVMNPVPTGVYTVDQLLQGGLDTGEIGVLIGPTRRGKTRSLINFGVAALRRGKVVAHLIVADSTTKRIARRYDSCLSDYLYNSLKSNPEKISNPLKKLQQMGARLLLKEYDKKAPSPTDIRFFLQRWTERNQTKIDLIILDYLDELRSTKHYQEKREESRDVTGDVRRLGAEFSCPVWTASQGNRASMKKKNVGLDDVAEDIWKVNQADVVITLNQTEEEEEENVIRYKVVKARRENFQPKTIMLSISPAGRLREVS